MWTDYMWTDYMWTDYMWTDYSGWLLLRQENQNKVVSRDAQRPVVCRE